MSPDYAPRHKRRFLIALVAAFAALAAVAYFFSDGSRGIKPLGPPEKATIAFSTATDAALAVVAQMRGLYREEGLETTARLHPYGKPALQDVLEGKADFATVAETPVMLAIMKGEKISVLATIQTTGQTNAVIARRDRGITAFEDIRGHKIAATSGTTSDYFLDAVLAARGISRKNVTVVDLKAEEIPEALVRGDIDAASAFHPYSVFAQKRLGDRGITLYDKDVYTWTFNMVATQEFIRRNPGKVVKMLRALIKAEEFVRRHPEEAQKIVADFGGFDATSVRDVWTAYDFRVKLDQSLLLAMEDESRWAMKNRLTGAREIPNYLNFIYFDGLLSVKPEAVRILR